MQMLSFGITAALLTWFLAAALWVPLSFYGALLPVIGAIVLISCACLSRGRRLRRVLLSGSLACALLAAWHAHTARADRLYCAEVANRDWNAHIRSASHRTDVSHWRDILFDTNRRLHGGLDFLGPWLSKETAACLSRYPVLN